ncbi:MFS transporter [Sulfurisphaera ohwakuensis]|uniref:MFS family permease n=1 Tax=Sulfurisphaera ohwakuensis TaxID=69656 RepID=A0A650CJD3_SULOH|nr:MFS transporter [Sulfurisphaera ohwakuensis]MBB5254002.1 MFS family permease [Sulfurisphaera ohwakuensis]QGR17883.1 MFS transporter [Sulfurisphaera ohwakuensis]
MKYFVGQTFIIAGLTMLSLLYPISLYQNTHSMVLLGLSITLNNIANGIGSYIWGIIIDKSEERYSFFILLPSVGMMISYLILKTSLGVIGYTILGFFSALDGPLYSVLLLEQLEAEKTVLGNVRLSQLSLAGNIIGSLLGALISDFRIMFILFLVALVLNIIFVPRYKGEIREDKKEKNKAIKDLYEALISFSMFNLSAEIFYVTYIPTLTLFRIPKYIYFLSYTFLYIINEFMYNKSIKIIKGNEIYYSFLVMSLRGIIMIFMGLITFLKINISDSIFMPFITFGSLYPLYSTSFFSLIFKNLQKNRGAILGIFNAGESFASAGGSALTALVSNNNISQAYFMGFFGFSLSFFLWLDFLNKRLNIKI